MKTKFFVMLVIMIFVSSIKCISPAHSVTWERNRNDHFSFSLSSVIYDETGTVSGSIAPATEGIVATLSDSKSLFTTTANSLTGQFTFADVTPGIYTLKVFFKNPDSPVMVKEFIEVNSRINTDVGVIHLPPMWK